MQSGKTVCLSSVVLWNRSSSVQSCKTVCLSCKIVCLSSVCCCLQWKRELQGCMRCRWQRALLRRGSEFVCGGVRTVSRVVWLKCAREHERGVSLDERLRDGRMTVTVRDEGVVFAWEWYERKRRKLQTAGMHAQTRTLANEQQQIHARAESYTKHIYYLFRELSTVGCK